jgi:site-specific DNA recombinase
VDGLSRPVRFRGGDVQARLTKLKAQSKRLRARRAQIEFDLEQPPNRINDAQLTKIRDQIVEIIPHGNHKAKKALFEALIDQIEIQTDDSLVPHFKIPAMTMKQGLALGEPALDQPSADDTVRVPPHLVEPRGLEPLTPALQRRCSAS